MNDVTLGFRDPHAFLREEVMAVGYETQEEEQVLLDSIDAMPRDVALLVFHVLDTRISNGLRFDSQELKGFILEEYREILGDTVRTLQ